MKTPNNQQNNSVATATAFFFYLQWNLHLCLLPNITQSEETIWFYMMTG